MPGYCVLGGGERPERPAPVWPAGARGGGGRERQCKRQKSERSGTRGEDQRAARPTRTGTAAHAPRGMGRPEIHRTGDLRAGGRLLDAANATSSDSVNTYGVVCPDSGRAHDASRLPSCPDRPCPILRTLRPARPPRAARPPQPVFGGDEGGSPPHSKQMPLNKEPVTAWKIPWDFGGSPPKADIRGGQGLDWPERI